MRKLAVLLLALVCVFGVAATLKVGVVLPLSGEGEEDGNWCWYGIELAHDMFGSYKGYNIELILKDDKTDPEVSKKVAEELINKGVVALIGWPWSGLALSGTMAAEKHKVPAICTWATNPLVTKGKKYVSRVVFTDEYQAEVIAGYFAEKGIKNVVVVMDTKQPYSTGLANLFKKEFVRKYKGRVLASLPIKTGDSEEKLAAVAGKILARKPAAVFAPIYGRELGVLAKLLKSKGYTGLIISGDTGGSSSVWESSEGAAEGLIFTDHYHIAGVTSEFGKQVLQKFKEKYGKELSYAAGAVAFDAYMVFYTALKNCVDAGKEPTPENLNYYIRHAEVHSLAYVKINPNTGNPDKKPAFLCRWHNGKVELVEVFQPK